MATTEEIEKAIEIFEASEQWSDYRDHEKREKAFIAGIKFSELKSANKLPSLDPEPQDGWTEERKIKADVIVRNRLENGEVRFSKREEEYYNDYLKPKDEIFELYNKFMKMLKIEICEDPKKSPTYAWFLTIFNSYLNGTAGMDEAIECFNNINALSFRTKCFVGYLEDIKSKHEKINTGK